MFSFSSHLLHTKDTVQPGDHEQGLAFVQDHNGQIAFWSGGLGCCSFCCSRRAALCLGFSKGPFSILVARRLLILPSTSTGASSSRFSTAQNCSSDLLLRGPGTILMSKGCRAWKTAAASAKFEGTQRLDRWVCVKSMAAFEVTSSYLGATRANEMG